MTISQHNIPAASILKSTSKIILFIELKFISGLTEYTISPLFTLPPSQTQLATINTNMDEANAQNFPPPPPTEEELEMRLRREFVETHQFPREDLLLQEKLGEGEYGPIYRYIMVVDMLWFHSHTPFHDLIPTSHS